MSDFKFTKEDNEKLHTYCEEGAGDPVIGRQFAGDVSRYIEDLRGRLALVARWNSPDGVELQSYRLGEVTDLTNENWRR